MLEEERQKQELLNAKVGSCDAMGHHQTLFQVFLVPQEASAELITALFRKLSVLSHLGKGGDVEMLKQFQQAQRILGSPEARPTSDDEGIETADALLCQLMS